MAKHCQEDGCLFDNNHGRDRGIYDSVMEGMTTTQELVNSKVWDGFLNSYGLSKLCVTPIARSMLACGFKYGG